MSSYWEMALRQLPIFEAVSRYLDNAALGALRCVSRATCAVVSHELQTVRRAQWIGMKYEIRLQARDRLFGIRRPSRVVGCTSKAPCVQMPQWTGRRATAVSTLSSGCTEKVGCTYRLRNGLGGVHWSPRHCHELVQRREGLHSLCHGVGGCVSSPRRFRVAVPKARPGSGQSRAAQPARRRRLSAQHLPLSNVQTPNTPIWHA